MKIVKIGLKTYIFLFTKDLHISFSNFFNTYRNDRSGYIYAQSRFGKHLDMHLTLCTDKSKLHIFL